jgi:O-antigen/teichoic acid export membrane protein
MAVTDRPAGYLWVAASAWLSRIFTAAAQLLATPLLLSWLGVDSYAVFAIVASLAGWTALVEFGTGPSLQNRCSVARATGGITTDTLAPLAPVLALLLIVSSGLLFAGSSPLQDALLRRFAGSPPGLLLAAGLLLVLSTLGGVSLRVFYAEQRGWISSIYQGSSAMLTLATVAVTVNRSSPSILSALLAWFGPPAVVNVVALLHVFARYGVRVRGAISSVRDSLAASWRFALLAGLSSAVLAVDYAVMSQILEPRDVARYNLVAKVFQFIFFLYSAILSAFWPTAAEHLARRDWPSLARDARRNLALGFLLVGSGIVVFALTRDIVVRFLSPRESLDLPLLPLLFLGAVFLVRVVTDLCAVILMSSGRVGLFLAYIPFQAAISITAQWLFARHYGLAGIPAGLLLSFLLTAAWIMPLAVARLHKSWR